MARAALSLREMMMTMGRSLEIHAPAANAQIPRSFLPLCDRESWRTVGISTPVPTNSAADSLRDVVETAPVAPPSVPPVTADELSANATLYELLGTDARQSTQQRAPKAQAPKCKVLMLHGWTQNAEEFRKRIGPLRRKAEKAGVELVFVDAPHELPPGTLEPGEDGNVRENPRSWFSIHRDPTDTSGAFEPVRRHYLGLEESMRFIQTEWERAGGFNGVFGFSQGAVMAHHIAQEAEAAKQAGRTPSLAPSFVVVASGYPARCASTFDSLSEDGFALGTPSLHIRGEDDRIVPVAVQEELEACFADPQVMIHNKGHSIPQQAADVKRMIAFMLKHKNDQPSPRRQTAPAKKADKKKEDTEKKEGTKESVAAAVVGGGEGAEEEKEEEKQEKVEEEPKKEHEKETAPAARAPEPVPAPVPAPQPAQEKQPEAEPVPVPAPAPATAVAPPAASAAPAASPETTTPTTTTTATPAPSPPESTPEASGAKEEEGGGKSGCVVQ